MAIGARDASARDQQPSHTRPGNAELEQHGATVYTIARDAGRWIMGVVPIPGNV